MDRPARFVIVELYDDAEKTAQDVAADIVSQAQPVEGGDIKSAVPAYEDSFGRLVQHGTKIDTQTVRSR